MTRASAGGVQPPSWLATVLDAGRRGALVRDWPRPGGDARASAVLLLFGPTAAAVSSPGMVENSTGEGVDVVLTQRADTLRKHAGQVSFPGGGVEPDDADVVVTALREAREEIGLSPRGVDVLGEMAPVALTVTNFTVHPVLAWWSVPSTVSALDPIEVASVVRVPVSDLLDPGNRHMATHPRGFQGPAFEAGGLYIWGFTAFVLDAVLREAGLAQPWDEADRRQVPERFVR